MILQALGFATQRLGTVWARTQFIISCPNVVGNPHQLACYRLRERRANLSNLLQPFSSYSLVAVCSLCWMNKCPPQPCSRCPKSTTDQEKEAWGQRQSMQEKKRAFQMTSDNIGWANSILKKKKKQRYINVETKLNLNRKRNIKLPSVLKESPRMEVKGTVLTGETKQCETREAERHHLRK